MFIFLWHFHFYMGFPATEPFYQLSVFSKHPLKLLPCSSFCVTSFMTIPILMSVFLLGVFLSVLIYSVWPQYDQMVCLCLIKHHVMLGSLSLGLKWSWCESNHSPPSNTKVKDAWSYTSTPNHGGVWTEVLIQNLYRHQNTLTLQILKLI
jgi:hypothetical protein